MDCKLCDHVEEDLKKLSNHIRMEHGLSSEQYTIKVLYKGVRPTCAECGGFVRYVAFSFKKYCKDHSRLAMKEGGEIGGKAESWNRGKTKDTDERIALQAAKMVGESNHFYGRQHTPETLRKISQSKTLETISIEERILQRSGEFSVVTPLEDYVSRQRQYLLFKCTKCGEVQPKTLQAFERGSRCYKCYPLGKSNWELSVYDYVKSLSSDAVSGDKRVISPKEIDIYVPSRKFGIECHGLYWHSEAGKPAEEFDKNCHANKFELARGAGIDLLQVFEDEWRDRRPIVESMIQYRLGVASQRCRTWSTVVVELSASQQRQFFNDTHISGYTPARVSWGLQDRSGLIVAAISLRRPRHSEKYSDFIEVARFSLARGFSVPGALSRLIKRSRQWSIGEGFSGIMTYVDRRIGSGSGYLAAGFQIEGSTGPDYWYTDSEHRYDRFKFRSQGETTERQLARSAGVSRIYGCGSLVMTMQICGTTLRHV